MISQLLSVVAPVFGVALVGWLFAGWRRVDLASLADITLYLAAPALVFSGLAGQQVQGKSLLLVGGGAVFQAVACGLAALLALRLCGISGRGLYLTAMFPNTGNLGLPLALFAFGQPGLAVAVIVFVCVTLAHYSLGFVIISRSLDPRRALSQPLLLAAVLGVVAAIADWQPPQALGRGLQLLGEACVPLMLISLGIRMRSVKIARPMTALLMVALRMVPGLLAGMLWVWWFGMQGAERGVLLVTGVLPSAVMNFVLAEVYGEQAEEVASIILIGTLISMLSIPLVLTYVV